MLKLLKFIVFALLTFYLCCAQRLLRAEQREREKDAKSKAESQTRGKTHELANTSIDFMKAAGLREKNLMMIKRFIADGIDVNVKESTLVKN